jgi:hypothetical protein
MLKNTLIDTDSKLIGMNIFTYMRDNVPFLVIAILSVLNFYFFSGIQLPCSQEIRIGIIVSFSLLAALDVVLTTLSCRRVYCIDYPQYKTHWWRYALIEVIISLFSFFSLNYFIHQGVPFTCFYEFNSALAQSTFYIFLTLIAGLGYFKHKCWKKLPIGINDNDYGQL